MNTLPTIRRLDFEQLVDEHHELIQLANRLEYQLYRLGEAATPEHVRDCQQIAGSLLGLLRANLFRHDQEVLPILESLVSDGEPTRPT